MFPDVLADRLHQPYRAPLVDGFEDILKLQAPGLFGCALSGAGPSILVFYEPGAQGVCELIRKVFLQRGREAEVLNPGIAQCGYEAD
jgi:homoserine kinase